MSPKTALKPKLRMAPSPEALADQQAAANRLLMLDSWTEAPAEPPPPGIAAAVTVTQVAASKPEKPASVRVMTHELKPWETNDANRAHPYHLVMSEGLFKKLDYVWKRAGHKSMRDLVLQTLDHMVDKEIKRLGQ